MKPKRKRDFTGMFIMAVLPLAKALQKAADRKWSARRG